MIANVYGLLRAQARALQRLLKHGRLRLRRPHPFGTQMEGEDVLEPEASNIRIAVRQGRQSVAPREGLQRRQGPLEIGHVMPRIEKYLERLRRKGRRIAVAHGAQRILQHAAPEVR